MNTDRRMYLRLAGLTVYPVFLAAWLARRWSMRAHFVATSRITAAAAVVVLLLAAVFSSVSFARGQEYRDALRLTASLVERWPTDHSRMVFADALIAAGRHDEAIAELRQA